MKPQLLSREDFKKKVFERDNYQCVVCSAPAIDAHHLIERKLFDDGGYYLDNGVSLCSKDHVLAEQTVLSCDELRAKAGIKNTVLPPYFDEDEKTDKWGNTILPTGMRLKGELFFEPNVQKILSEAGILDQFSKYLKYPKTMHLPFSPGIGKLDRVLNSLSHFEGKEVVVTLKMDGENTNLYSDYLHARSTTFKPHPSRTWIKSLHAQIKDQIPVDWRICGENLYAKHSIFYQHLVSYFVVFCIWNQKNQCLSWDETCEWAELLGLVTAPVLYRGIWDEKKIRNLYTKQLNGDECEGFVVRLAESYSFKDFSRSTAKYVRAGHVQTSEHWLTQEIVPNKLKK